MTSTTRFNVHERSAAYKLGWTYCRYDIRLDEAAPFAGAMGLGSGRMPADAEREFRRGYLDALAAGKSGFGCDLVADDTALQRAGAAA